MALPLFFPDVRYVPRLSRDGAMTLEELCELASVRCQALGAWVRRPVILLEVAPGAKPWIQAEPGGWGAVQIGVPRTKGSKHAARWALGALAYSGLFDQVARASVFGQDWARIEVSRGRRPDGLRPLSNSERQRRHRKRQLAESR